jgi:Phage integrase, N-terminal SAM-like domain
MTTEAITPLRQRMIEDMNARKLCAGTQRGHIRACKRFAAFLKRSPETATLEDIRRFQLHLVEAGVSICTRNVIMTGLRFLLRVTLRRLDLAAEMYHLRAPQKIPRDHDQIPVRISGTIAVSRDRQPAGGNHDATEALSHSLRAGTEKPLRHRCARRSLLAVDAGDVKINDGGRVKREPLAQQQTANNGVA